MVRGACTASTSSSTACARRRGCTWTTHRGALLCSFGASSNVLSQKLILDRRVRTVFPLLLLHHLTGNLMTKGKLGHAIMYATGNTIVIRAVMCGCRGAGRHDDRAALLLRGQPAPAVRGALLHTQPRGRQLLRHVLRVHLAHLSVAFVCIRTCCCKHSIMAVRAPFGRDTCLSLPDTTAELQRHMAVQGACPSRGQTRARRAAAAT